MRIALVVAVLIAAALVLVSRTGSREERRLARVAQAQGATAQDSLPLRADVGPAARRSEALAAERDAPLNEGAGTTNSKPGVVRVELRDTTGAPVPGTVVLRRPQKARVPATTVEVGATGIAEVTGLEPGEFVPFVEPDSIPSGYLPPFSQDRAVPYARDGLGARSYTAPAPGEAITVRLTVLRPARVTGRVLGPLGEGVEGVMVGLQSRFAGFESLRPYAETDASGRFEIAPVYPGPYRSQLSMPREHPYVAERRPTPSRIDIEPEQEVELILQLGGAGDTGVIEGLVVDESGTPMPGIGVRCIYTATPDEHDAGENLPGINDTLVHTWTDPAGRYRLSPLPSRLVTVCIGIGNYDFVEPWDGDLAELPPPFKVDLAHERSPFVAVTTVVQRNDAYRLVATIRLDPDWAAANRVRGVHALDAEIRTSDGRVERAHIVRGELRWGMMKPSGSALVLVRERRTGAEQSLEVFPRTAVRESVVIAFP